MVNSEVHHLRPYGWQSSHEERFKISTLDSITGPGYTHFAIYFRLEDADKPKVTTVLKEGLERTLAQIGHLCSSTIEEDPEGGLSFVKRKDSAVPFIVQRLDAPEDADKFPSLNDMESSSFAGLTLGDLKNWTIKPEEHPHVAAFLLNFVRGGLVLITHIRRYANDFIGWTGFIHQLAETCYAITNNTPFPTWDPTCSDVSSVTRPTPPPEERIDGPPPSQIHADQKPGQCLLFHLPKSKAAQLKQLATPLEGWISTYDACCAFIWRTVTRLRQPVFKTPLETPILWAEAVDMRRRMTHVHPRTQHNILWGAMSDQAPFPPATHGEVISEKPLSELAAYIRRLTDSQTEENVHTALTAISYIKHEHLNNLSMRIDSRPPMSTIVTDHRAANVTDADFGFARPLCHRHLQQGVGITVGVHLIYPPKFDPNPDSDEGCIFALMYEKELAQELIDDEEFGRFFEYRGVDSE